MYPFDDDETTGLEVIDATLAGEAVAPEHAELAELTLILAGQHPVPSPEFTNALDERVARRFAAQPVPRPAAVKPRGRHRWLYAPGVALAFAAVVALVIVAGGNSNSTSSSSSSAAASAPQLLSAPTRQLHPDSSSGRAKSAPNGAPRTNSGAGAGSVSTPSSAGASSAGASSAGTLSAGTGSAASSPALTPPTSHRQVVQSAQLALSTRPNQVDNVAQQVFNVISAQNGVVNDSQVTATNSSSGYAQFSLSVPSANLSQTMSALSRLHGASVVSRTDATQDITQQVGGAGMRLAEARALRTSLLKQLANAATTARGDSLKAQIRDADASIASDEATLRSLHRQVNYSRISVSINAAMAPGHPVSGGGFTLGKATHDAGRVLVVAAGVALIALAVLVPLGLVIGLLAWIGYAVRRRRREQALDLV
jgi:hypothetical protein